MISKGQPLCPLGIKVNWVHKAKNIGLSLLPWVVCLMCPWNIAQAQSIVPASDGTGTIVTPNNNPQQFDIQGGTQSGANLFHSFSQFGLDQGQIANFLSNPTIQNILTRVTGGSASYINGLIQVTGGSSNLYIMNPAGIVFGPNASLNVPASFTATTATGIGLDNNQLFSATEPNNYATLVGQPSNFNFATSQTPGAVVNMGQLSVSQGNNLSLVGGTVVSTGQLNAPGGQINITAVPGQSTVLLSAPGNVLSLEVPASEVSTITPSTLPQLLTGSGQSTGLAVNSSGQVELTGSNIPIHNGDVVIKGSVTAQTATVSAQNNLILVESQLQTTGDLNLLAQNTVMVRDTATNPFLAQAGGNLYIQGNYEIDILALNTPYIPPFQSGGNLSFVSDGIISFDSHSQSGGSILFHNLSGGPANVYSYYDPIITSGGNIALGNYTGAALKVDSGGTITAGDITITQPDTLSIPTTDPDYVILTTTPSLILKAAGSINVGNINTSDQSVGDAGHVRLTAQGNITTGDINARDLGAGNAGSVSLLSAGGNIQVENVNTTNLNAGNSGSITMIGAGTVTHGELNWNNFGTGNQASSPVIMQNLGGTNTPPPTGGTTTPPPGGTTPPPGGTTTPPPTGGTTTPPPGGTTPPPGGTTTPTPTGGTTTPTPPGGTTTPPPTGGTTTPPPGGTTPPPGGTTTPPPTGGTTTPPPGGTTTPTPPGGTTTPTPPGGTTTPTPTGGTTTPTPTGGTTTPTPTGGTTTPTPTGGTTTPTPTGGTTTPTPTGGTTTPTPTGGTTTPTPTGGTTTPTPTGGTTTPTPTGGTTTPTPTGGTTTPTPTGGTTTPTPTPTGGSKTTPSSGSTTTTSGDSITTPAGGSKDNASGGSTNSTSNTCLSCTSTDSTVTTPSGIANHQSSATTSTTSRSSTVATSDGSTPNSPNSGGANNPSGQGNTNHVHLGGTSDSPTTSSSPQQLVGNSSSSEVKPNLVSSLEEPLTNQFEQYFGHPDKTPTVTLADARNILRKVEKATGVKPALIYATFVPQRIVANGVSNVSTPDQNSNLETPNSSYQLELVLVTGEGEPIRRQVTGATRENVLQVVYQFQSEVTNAQSGRDYEAPSKQLYQWLIAPLDAEIKARGIQNLSFIMDSGLRSLPIAALYDGQQFLVEKYSLGLMPSLSLITDTNYKSIKDLQVLAMGASKFPEKSPLPAVPVELSLITPSLWQGKAFLNDNFTLANLKEQREQKPFGLIHLATHATFRAGAPGNSYIEFWDTKLQLDQLPGLGWGNPPVELLVLSACKTALGDQQAELGFAGLAVQAGVKSAIASLWSVSDEGTLALMTQLYQQLKVSPIKAGALQQAQIAMLRGQVSLKEGKLFSGKETVPLPPELVKLGTRNLTHPYFWAGFTMIGSPW
ncbi:CHAT domain-containing protein [Allocoleopsis franciscana]|nr:CHAT domain-containing protein [Allocoleopsis franciscana]